MEQLVILIVIAVISLINWMLQKREQKPQPPAQQQRRTPTMMQERQQETEEERMRRFLDALGIPKAAAPEPRPRPETRPRPAPPPVVRQEHPVTRPIVPTLEPPVEQITVPVAEAPPQPDNLEETIQALSLPEEVEELTVSQAGEFQALLTSPQDVRKAVVLRELLGPPRGLQTRLQPSNLFDL